ncbi:hypothetical protein LSH36_556g01036 [Paralvinella palmiformis]|uniref:Uncharacterized protein n=1 Tax=Paralvinella palmiformis TaxID=53620 RepID=A0AAD9J683_9ANNE|nr:hypothetical protein LSH36_556g01036 [Paralvinella palmiformis]
MRGRSVRENKFLLRHGDVTFFRCSPETAEVSFVFRVVKPPSHSLWCNKMEDTRHEISTNQHIRIMRCVSEVTMKTNWWPPFVISDHDIPFPFIGEIHESENVSEEHQTSTN